MALVIALPFSYVASGSKEKRGVAFLSGPDLVGPANICEVGAEENPFFVFPPTGSRLTPALRLTL